MKNLFARFVREEEGQDIIEYALLAAFISIVAWLILQNIGQDVQTMYSNVQAATNDDDFDFLGWGQERFDKAVADFRSPQLDTWLEAATS